ncbi:MAG: DUF167 domain-containing protein [Ignavibacteriales bacterium]|nr:DUF167 domain-containing protein [Ignavibacteriales bacterium]
MIISVLVKPRSKQPGISKNNDSTFVVRVASPPVDGKANDEVIEQLSKFFSIPPSRIVIKSGHTSKRKIIAIL